MPGQPHARLSTVVARYALAGLAIVAAAGVRAAFSPWLEHESSPFIFFAPAVMAAGWLGGLGPGLFATALGGVIGDYFWVEPLYTLVIWEPHEFIHTAIFLGIGTVISLMSRSLGRARAAAVAANRAKDRFLAVLSHELRNPLAACDAALASLAEHEAALPAEGRRDLALVRRNTRYQARLIEDLLDLSRVAEGKLHVRPQACDLADVLAAAADNCRDEAAALGLTLTYEFAATNRRLYADPARVQQLVWNLLKNAMKFTPPGGRIALRAADAVSPATAQVTVRDTGPGIAPDVIGRIFEPFTQGPGDGPLAAGGLGIGLAVCRTIAALSGGSIGAHSDGPGRGATFTVLLPARPADPDESRNPAPGAAAAPARAPGIDILLVEDDPDAGPALRRLLEHDGHRVVLATRVADALTAAAAAARPIGLIISDLRLPDGSGTDLLATLRVRRGPTRAICLSGSDSPADRAASAHAGFERHLTKPVDLTALRQWVSLIGRDGHAGDA